MQFFRKCMFGKKLHVDMKFLHVNIQKIACQHAIFNVNMRFYFEHFCFSNMHVRKKIACSKNNNMLTLKIACQHANNNMRFFPNMRCFSKHASRPHLRVDLGQQSQVTLAQVADSLEAGVLENDKVARV